METKLEEMTQKLGQVIVLVHDCQAHVGSLLEAPPMFTPTLIRLQILRVKNEHMRQLIADVERIGQSLLVADEDEDEDEGLGQPLLEPLIPPTAPPVA